MDPEIEPKKAVEEQIAKAFPSLLDPYSRWLPWTWRWKPTSEVILMQVEKEILNGIGIPFEQQMIEIGNNEYINTIKVGQGPPLVLLHGFAAGVGFWVCNLKELAKENTVYAIDLPGFGRSSRPAIKGDSLEDFESFFLERLEKWRETMNLTSFNLMGHSFGGYLSCVYALKYPSSVSHLLLADPWGVPQPPQQVRLPWHWRLIASVLLRFNPLATVRAAGPYGPGLIQRFRGDIMQKFAHVFEDPTVVARYIYHMNAQNPSGETMFANMSSSFGWAKKPLLDRDVHLLPPKIRVSLLYGDQTWMDRNAGRALKDIWGDRANFYTISRSGHHIYVDNAEEFHRVILHELRNK